MGKYTDQASSYKMGMNSLQASLEDILLEIEKVDKLIKDEDVKDALNYYVNKFNEDTKEILVSLCLKCTAIPVSVMNKAKEIDRQIELEQEALRRQQEEIKNTETSQTETPTSTSLIKGQDVALKKDKLDIKNKMGW